MGLTPPLEKHSKVAFCLNIYIYINNSKMLSSYYPSHRIPGLSIRRKLENGFLVNCSFSSLKNKGESKRFYEALFIKQ